MPIPIRKFPIKLKKTEPSKLTPEDLQLQLVNIGLDCKYTTIPKLRGFIEEVDKELPQGKVESFGILKPAEKKKNRIAGYLEDWEKSSNASWEPENSQFNSKLMYIQTKDHFDWLKANRPGFTGITADSSFEGLLDTVAAVKNQFADTAITASSAVVKGLDKVTLHSILSDSLGKIDDKSAQNYDKSDSRVIFLLYDYNPSTEEAAGVGVLTVEWTLKIENYKEKKKEPQHKTSLKVDARSVLYTTVETLDEDYNAVKAQFGAFHISGIPIKKSIKIYDKQPPANEDTFQNSLKTTAKATYMDALVLFSPDLQLIGTVDNNDSEVTTSYTKSVTTGFTFSSTQSFGIEAGFEAGIVLVKGSLKVSFSISFTEQYSKQSTESVNFSVPAGKKAFLYQGTLRSRILRYDPSAPNGGSYTYMGLSSFLSEIFATNNKPVVGDSPVIQQQIVEGKSLSSLKSPSKKKSGTKK